jgi:hypothetical protein
MPKTTQNLVKYLENTLGINALLSKWDKVYSLPFYLREHYLYYIVQFKVDLFGSKLLLLIDSGNDEQSAAKIKKNIEFLRNRYDIETVYVRDAITTYNRKRLIEYHIPFIIPYNQMYLPTIGLDLREYMRQIRASLSLFSPSTQVLMIYALINNLYSGITPSEIGSTLGYSSMTVIRAFNQLEQAEIADHYKVGKERHLQFLYEGKELWNKGQVFLSSPVKNSLEIHISNAPLNYPLAGLSALAKHTMIGEPTNPVLAVFSRKWGSATADRFQAQHQLFGYPDTVRLELWKYDPCKLTQRDTVDFLSLYLSLREDENERVQDSLESLIGSFRW